MAKKDKGSKSKDWEKELEEEAAEESSREKARAGGGDQVSIKGRRFTLDGEKLGRKMTCVIVDFVYLRTYYKGKFKEDSAGIPTCFALSEDGKEMAPHENSPKPQSKKGCEKCPHAQWGSAKRGRGQACADRRKLMLIHVDDLDDIGEANMVPIVLPPTSLKNWAAYVKNCKTKLGRPYYTVTTELSFDTEEDWPVLTFETVDKLDKEQVDGIKERREKEAREALMVPFEGDEDEESDEDEEDEDESPRKGKGKKGKSKSREDDDEDEEDDDEDDDDDEEDDEEDEEDDEEDDDARKRKRGKSSARASKSGSRRKKARDEDDEGDDDDSEDEEEDDDDDEDGRPKGKKGKSRFGKK